MDRRLSCSLGMRWVARVDETGEVCDRLEAETKQAVHSLESRVKASMDAAEAATVQAPSNACRTWVWGASKSSRRRIPSW